MAVQPVREIEAVNLDFDLHENYLGRVEHGS
jgi:hypothetical protein